MALWLLANHSTALARVLICFVFGFFLIIKSQLVSGYEKVELSFNSSLILLTIVKLMILLTIVKLMESDNLRLSFKKCPHVIFLLVFSKRRGRGATAAPLCPNVGPSALSLSLPFPFSLEHTTVFIYIRSHRVADLT